MSPGDLRIVNNLSLIREHLRGTPFNQFLPGHFPQPTIVSTNTLIVIIATDVRVRCDGSPIGYSGPIAAYVTPDGQVLLSRTDSVLRNTEPVK